MKKKSKSKSNPSDIKKLKMYNEIAPWWFLLSRPESYIPEAKFYHKILQKICKPKTLLELGSGGGNNAFHLKKHYQMTLVDISPGMLKMSRKINPGLKHIQGDMKTVRLGKVFDAVFIHDAVMYMTTSVDLKQAMETAYIHCKENGVVLLAPDYTKESFKEETKSGGYTVGNRGLRYLMWSYDPDKQDNTCITDFVYLLRKGNTTQMLSDRHIFGLFNKSDWIKWLKQTGFKVKVVRDEFKRDLFICKKQKN